MKNNLDKITDKQQAFVNEYLSNGYSPTQAYITVYGVKEKVATAAGSRLLQHPNIVKQIEKHQAKLLQRVVISKEDIIRDLLSIKDRHINGTAIQSGVAIKALENITKMLGYNEPEKTETTISFKAQFPGII